MLPLEIENRLSDIQSEMGKLAAELVDINFRRTRGRSVVTIIADKQGGITLEECAAVNRALSGLFDELIEGPYFLEVNSPGLDRPIKNEEDFLRAIGEKVKVTYRGDGEKIFQYIGEVYEVKDGIVRFIRSGDSQVFWVKMNAIVKAAREISLKG